MSVNFYKNRDQMVTAYKEVINEKSATDWALFGYEKQTNDLTLVGQGSGGLDELYEEFNSSKILYAFCKVKDPNTELIKYILINWQGEGAPLQRKGICINHFRDIQNFFKGSHIVFNARNEEDVESSTIMSRVTKVSAKVNLKDRSDLSENISPVGTNYKRVQPQREISQTDREKFWIQTQEDEKIRLSEEKKKASEARALMEREREERELKELRQRDAVDREKDLHLSKLRESEQNAANAKKNNNTVESNNVNSIDDNERRKRSEMLRKERAEEVKAVIPQRSIKTARAIFEQNTSAGQLNSVRNNYQSENKLISNRKELFETNNKSVPISTITSINTKANAPKQEVVHTLEDDNHSIPAHLSPDLQTQVNTELSNSLVNSPIYEPNEPEVQSEEPEIQTESEAPEIGFTRNLLQETYIDNHQLEDIAEEQGWDDPNNVIEEDVYDNTENIMSNEKEPLRHDDGLKARALFDYQAADETEISFDPDDIIRHIEQIDSGWWQGLASDGTYGLFPANYVELID